MNGFGGMLLVPFPVFPHIDKCHMLSYLQSLASLINGDFADLFSDFINYG